jgi:hypothetical protein
MSEKLPGPTRPQSWVPLPVDNRQNGDGVGLFAEENGEREATDLRATNVAIPEYVELRVGTDPGPTGLDLEEEFGSETAPLEFVPEKLGFKFELGAPTDP